MLQDASPGSHAIAPKRPPRLASCRDSAVSIAPSGRQSAASPLESRRRHPVSNPRAGEHLRDEVYREPRASPCSSSAPRKPQPTLPLLARRPAPRKYGTKTALNAFTNPFAQRPDEIQELEPYETAPLFGECRRKLAACIIVGFEDFGGVATNAQAEVEVAAADVRLEL